MKKILLFGSGGFIGTNFRQYFQNNKQYKLITPSAEKNDVLKALDIKKIIQKISPHFIINTAYYGGVSSSIKFSRNNLNKNLDIIQSILEGSKGIKSIKKIIFFGSSLEYADSTKPIAETHPVNPKNTYATIKSITSLLSLVLAKELHVPLLLIRPFNLFGPYDRKSVIYYLIKSILDKKPIEITKGEQTRDYLYIDDFVKIISDIIKNYQKIENYEIYNVGSGKATKLKTIFSLIFQLTDFSGKVKYCDNCKNEYWYQVANIEKIKKLIQIKSSVSLMNGLKKTTDWIKST